MGHFRNWREENSPGIPAHWIFQKYKFRLQTFSASQIVVCLLSWNYTIIDIIIIKKIIIIIAIIIIMIIIIMIMMKKNYANDDDDDDDTD